MIKRIVATGAALLVFCLSPLALAQSQVVIEDGGVSIDEQELRQIVSRWTPQMQQAAANDRGDRLELLNVALAAKKIALEADKLTPEKDGEAYWRYILLIRGAQQRFVLQNFMDSLEVPDMTAVAQERYEANKRAYGLVPEQRSSSHILFACRKETGCDRRPLRLKVQELLDELRQGADFTSMVETYSDDPGTKAKGGKFDHWMKLGDPQVTPPYSAGVFDIAEIGGYSDMVESPFGIHIIRLDDVQEESFLSYEEVKEKAIASLTAEYRKLAAKDFNRRFQISDQAVLDDAVMEQIFQQYKTVH